METILLITAIIMYAIGIYVGRNWEYFTEDE